MAHRPPHDPPEHVAPPLVRRQHPVGDQERGRAQVVGDHPVVHLPRPVGVAVGRLGRGLDQRPHQVGVVVVVLALQHRPDPLQPHAGVDRRPRQRHAAAVLELLELHEDEVPDLDEPVAVLVRAPRRPARDALPVVVEDLRAGPARAGRPHHPEIVHGGDADDPLVRQPRHLLPEVRRHVVVVIDRDRQPVLRQPEVAGQKLPRQRDRPLLEIVPERKIPQHLEERMVPRRIAHVVEVVVLAPGPHALLAGRGAHVVALLDAGEDVLELHHAGVGEHERRVVARHQRRGGHHLVPLAGEIVEKGGADVVEARHGSGRPGCRARSGVLASRPGGVHRPPRIAPPPCSS